MSEWISVEDRLPDKSKDVLIVSGKEITVAYLDQWLEWSLGGDYECTYDMADCVLTNKKPTHWMPLPEPPKSEVVG